MKKRKNVKNNQPQAPKYLRLKPHSQIVGCTSLRMLARRMAGFTDYQELFLNGSSLPHAHNVSGLKYMHDYSPAEEKEFLTDDEYIKAVFVRDPKERFLSAWLNKAVRYPYAARKCCPAETLADCAEYSKASFLNFFYFASECKDVHWMPQTELIGEKYLPYINFVGRLENIGEDTERLLKQIGAWESCGKDGWGEDGKSSFGRSQMKGQHASTNSSSKLETYFTPDLERKVENLYQQDYGNKYIFQSRV